MMIGKTVKQIAFTGFKEMQSRSREGGGAKTNISMHCHSTSPPPQFGPSKIFHPLHPETDLELGYGGLRGIKGSLLSSHMDIFISGESFDPGFL